MALNIRNSETEKLVVALTKLTGESKTEAVTKALQDRLERIKKQKDKRFLSDRLNEIAQHCASLPLLTKQNPESMLYDEHGLPK